MKHHFVSAKFIANNVVNIAIGYTLFFLNFGDHPFAPLVLLCNRGVLAD